MKKAYLIFDYREKDENVNYNIIDFFKDVFPELYFRYYVIDDNGHIDFQGESYVR